MLRAAAFALACASLSTVGQHAAAGTPAPPKVRQTDSCTAEQFREFDFWIGQWTGEAWTRPFGEAPAFGKTADLQLDVAAKLDGCLIVEYTRMQSVTEQGAVRRPGYSVRYFDPARQAWRAVLLWPDPTRSRSYEMTGQVHHARAEFFRKLNRPDAKPLLARFTFSDVQADSLRWDAAIASEDWAPVDFEHNAASVWFTESKFELRRADTALPAFDFVPLCAPKGLPILENALGSWGGSQSSERLEVRDIAAGCGWELEMSGDSAAYLLFAFQSDTSEWRVYSFEPGRHFELQVTSSTNHGLSLTDTDGREMTLAMESNGSRITWSDARQTASYSRESRN